MTEALIYSVASPKLPMILEGRNVVRLGGFDGGFVVTDEYRLAVDLYSRFVRVVASVRSKANSLKSSLAISMDSSIHSILRARGESHIFFPAIKPVAVLMVNALRRESHNESMKGNLFSAPAALRNLGNSVKSVAAFCGVPLEAANKVRILIVNQCRFALSQFDMFHIRIVPNFSVTETPPTGIKNDVKEKPR